MRCAKCGREIRLREQMWGGPMRLVKCIGCGPWQTAEVAQVMFRAQQQSVFPVRAPGPGGYGGGCGCLGRRG